MTKDKLTKEQIKEMDKLYRAGVPIATIADRLGVRRNRIYQRRYRLNEIHRYNTQIVKIPANDPLLAALKRQHPERDPDAQHTKIQT